MPSDAHDAEAVALDLVPVDHIAPRLKKVVVGAIVAGVVIALLANLFLPTVVAVVIGLIVVVPTAGSAWVFMRRRVWLTGTVIHVRGGLGTKTVSVPELVSAEMQVRAARVDVVTVALSDGRSRVTVALAMYAKGGGRELPIMSLRKLADALWTSELIPAAAIASVLVEQLKAEAREAGLGERPLYRAVELVKDAGRTPVATLTDREVAELAP